MTAPGKSSDAEAVRARFYAQVKAGNGPSACWLWRGAMQNGVPMFYAGTWREYAQRVAYRLERGQIPAGYKVERSCATERCVRLDHLRLKDARPSVAPPPTRAPRPATPPVALTVRVYERDAKTARIVERRRYVFFGFSRADVRALQQEQAGTDAYLSAALAARSDPRGRALQAEIALAGG